MYTLGCYIQVPQEIALLQSQVTQVAGWGRGVCGDPLSQKL